MHHTIVASALAVVTLLSFLATLLSILVSRQNQDSISLDEKIDFAVVTVIAILAILNLIF